MRSISKTYIRFILSTVLINILIAGAAHSANITIPKWVLSPPSDTDTTLYGVGERNTLDQAKKAALAEIAGKLGTVINSDTSIQSKLQNNKSQESFVENIKSKVSNTEFSQFEVVNAEHGGDLYWVLIKVDKPTMAKNLQNKIELSRKQINMEFTDFEGYSSLQKTQTSQTLKNKLDQLQTSVLTLHAIAPQYGVDSVMQDIRDKNKLLSKAKNDIEIKIEHDKDTKSFARNLEAMLSEKKFKIVNTDGRKGKTIIVISSDVQYFYILKDHHAKMVMKIQTIDESGKILTTSNQSITGYSPTSKQSALEQANKKLAAEFSNKGLLDSIGL